MFVCFFYMCYSLYIKYVYIGENIVIHIHTYTYSYVFIHIHYIYVISTGTGTSRSVGSCIIVGSSLWAVVQQLCVSQVALDFTRCTILCQTVSKQASSWMKLKYKNIYTYSYIFIQIYTYKYSYVYIYILFLVYSIFFVAVRIILPV